MSLKSLLLTVALCCVSVLFAQANLIDCGVDLGVLSPYGGSVTYTDGSGTHTVTHTGGWAAFTLGDMVDRDDLSGSSMITGDVGVGGTGNLTMTGSSTINGDVWQHTGGTFNTYSPSSITAPHHRFQSSVHDRILDQGAIDAINADNQAWNLMVSPLYTGLTNIQTSSNYTLNADHTGTHPDCTVLKLQNFKLSGGGVFTLSGTAADHFIINVANTFSLSGGAKIVLSGGVTWDNVLVNVHGSGSDVSISSSSGMSGILLAAKRKVTLSGSEITQGSVIANKLVLSGSSKINLPPVVSH